MYQLLKIQKIKSLLFEQVASSECAIFFSLLHNDE